jgi:HEAT repeat protein
MSCHPWLLVALALAGAPNAPAADSSPDERTLQTAGLATDGPALLEFFRTRSRLDGDPQAARELARQLGDPAPDVRARAAAGLVSWGPLAVPVLRNAANDLADPAAAEQARRCLKAIEGPPGAAVAAAAARLLTVRAPAGAAEALVTYLPFADDATVADEVTRALKALAFPDGKPDPALLRALKDPVALRRAAACDALCRADHPGEVPEVRKLLQDPKPSVRLRAAVALARQRDPEAVPVLIDLLAELPGAARRPAEEALQDLAGEWAPGVTNLGEDDVARRIHRDVWAAWWKNTDGPTLLAEFKKRTLGPEERRKVEALVARLGDEDFAAREQATVALVGVGRAAVPMLREAARGKDMERARRAEACLERISRGEGKPLPAVAARLVAMRRPDGAVGVLLDYLPWAEGEQIALDVEDALLALGVSDGKPDPALEPALADALGVKRAAAAMVLARRAGPEFRPAVRKLLHDPDDAVRFRVALALGAGGDRDAVPALIDQLADLPTELAWQAEDALRRLAGEKSPDVPLGEGDEPRRKCRDAWAAWWKASGAGVDLAALASGGGLGFTLLVEVDDNGTGRVRELTRDGKARWEIANLQYPVDAQALPGDRVLIAEFNGRRVTERDLKGNVLWKKENLPANVINAQRLPTGNTFIVTQQELLEVDRDGQTVFNQKFTNDNLIAACKSRDGEIFCLTGSGQCLRLDGQGKEVARFSSGRGPSWTSGIDAAGMGRVLVAQPDRNQVTLFDRDGKAAWQGAAPAVTTATWLPDGHVLVASYNNRSLVELDAAGKTVTQLTSDKHVFRARRR